VILFARNVLVDSHVPSGLAHVFLTIEAWLILAAGALIYRAFASRVAEHV
jgi:hypothetical protein